MLDTLFLGNPVWRWLIAVAVAVAVVLVLVQVRRQASRLLLKLAERTDTRFDDYLADIVRGTSTLFLGVLAGYAAIQFVDLAPRTARLFDKLAVVAFLLQAALWGNRLVVHWLRGTLGDRSGEDGAAATSAAIGSFLARLVLWVVVLLLILENLGVNITALVASLGIGGVAVALAVQNILGDVFASLSIALDKPFVIGDFVVVDTVSGTVEYVGIKTTRVRALTGEQVVFANADLLKSRIHNYQRLQERRIVFPFGVTYQASHEQLAAIPEMVKSVVESQPQVRFDRAHFKAFGDSSLDFEVVYYVQDRDYRLFMDTQQAINLALFKRFADEGIDFAYPTRTVHLVNAA